jgi:hypothetical protein
MASQGDKRYSPPGANVADVSNLLVAPAVPKSILYEIRNAWILGLVECVVFSFTVFRAVLVEGGSILLVVVWLCLCGATYGVYRRSRICAALLLLSSFWNVGFNVFRLASGTGPWAGGLLVGLFVVYMYSKGMHGTVIYHKLINHPERATG